MPEYEIGHFEEPEEEEPEELDDDGGGRPDLEPVLPPGQARPGQRGFETQKAMEQAVMAGLPVISVSEPSDLDDVDPYGGPPRPMMGSVPGNKPPDAFVEAHAFPPGEFAEYCRKNSIPPKDLLNPPKGKTLSGIERVLYRHYLLNMPHEDRMVLYAEGKKQGGVIKDTDEQITELGGMESVRLMAYALTQQALKHHQEKESHGHGETEESRDHDNHAFSPADDG